MAPLRDTTTHAMSQRIQDLHEARGEHVNAHVLKAETKQAMQQLRMQAFQQAPQDMKGKMAGFVKNALRDVAYGMVQQYASRQAYNHALTDYVSRLPALQNGDL